jgi:hypothetical protein
MPLTEKIPVPQTSIKRSKIGTFIPKNVLNNADRIHLSGSDKNLGGFFGRSHATFLVILPKRSFDLRLT